MCSPSRRRARNLATQLKSSCCPILTQKKKCSENGVSSISKRGFDCSTPVWGLTHQDCQHMSDVGFGSMGKNMDGDNGVIWVGDDGHTTFTFTNRAGADACLTVVVWLHTDDYVSSFVNVRQPHVTWSLPGHGDSVTVSMAPGISGAFAALHRGVTVLRDGQVFNTWGEWSTGPHATVDVSRQPRMDGNRMEIETAGGCRANMDRCVFKCRHANRCGPEGDWYLENCEAGSQPGNPHFGFDHLGKHSGGCGGYENGGHVQVDFHD
ncbi:hypothetical protein MY4824_008448 [Beauveria thailandica]